MDRTNMKETMDDSAEETIQIIHNRNERLIDELRKIYRSRIESENRDYESLINECNCSVKNKRSIRID